MPGIFGYVSKDTSKPVPDLENVSTMISYNKATVVETFEDDGVAIGCAHLGTGGQRALFQSQHAAVLIFGYLTKPAVPPGSEKTNPTFAARYVHDCYIKQGHALLHNIKGAFALAIWDRKNRELLLATDNLGLRPIYFSDHAGLFRFSSEVKGILVDPSFPHRVNHSAVSDLLYYTYILGNKTLFENIFIQTLIERKI